MSGTTELVVSGASYNAALSDIKPKRVTAKGYGLQVTLEAPDAETREAWVERLIVAACDVAGNVSLANQLYKDVERADLAAGRTPMT